ncbi:hypothetical protein [Salmonella bongori]|uniref:Uncharacterized protein n=1 Tax=Salmonella bongori N268-08 TaxID=1197719 RepID=S5MYK2_SALBN|nr:hypothetical protein [Salmonella bongori]AGR59684.1 hypothetical protein A464_2499 [Salmonella bongori N268-08]
MATTRIALMRGCQMAAQALYPAYETYNVIAGLISEAPSGSKD